MNYTLSCTRLLDNFPQSVVVKLKGGTGQKFTTMRSFALYIRDFDQDGQSGSGFKSMNYTTFPSDTNNPEVRLQTAIAIIKFNEPNSIDNDTPRSTTVEIKNEELADGVVNTIKRKFTEVTGKSFDDTRLYVSNIIFNLVAIPITMGDFTNNINAEIEGA